MVKEEIYVWAILIPIFGTIAYLWIDSNGVGSFIGLMIIVFGLALLRVLAGKSSSSGNDEITVIDKDGKVTKYVKKD